MAGGVVVALLLLQWWNNLAADSLGLPAARMKITTRWWIDGTGYIALKNDTFAFAFNDRVRHRDR